MKRGEVWTVSGGPDYAGKPRPAVIVQDDRFEMTASVTVCAFTSDSTEAPLFRLLVRPSATNGLRAESRLMVDRIMPVPRVRLGMRIGRLSDMDMLRLNRAVVVFLGIGASSQADQIR
jgi:mRNA interferase MazF